jgi:uncharacterized protein
VGIILGIDRANIQAIKELYPTLAEFTGMGRLAVWIAFIFRNTTGNAHCLTHSLGHIEMSDLYGEMISLGRRHGLNVTNTIALGLCNLESYSTPVIDPNGGLNACLSMVGMPENVVGHVSENPRLFMQRKAIAVARMPWRQECDECSYLPLCRGGCRYKALVEGDDLGQTVCKIRLMSRAVPDLVRLLVSEGKQPSERPCGLANIIDESVSE